MAPAWTNLTNEDNTTLHPPVDNTSMTSPPPSPMLTLGQLWLTGCGDRQEGSWVLSATLVLELLLGLPTNTWVLGLILGGAWGAGGAAIPPSEILSLNLACMELLCVPVISVLYNLNQFVWRSYDVFVGMSFFCGFVFAGRPLMLCLVCVERYLAVVHPITYLRYRAPRYKLGCLGVVWLLTILVCAVLTYFQTIFVTPTIIVPLLAVDSFCSLSILRVLRRPPPGDGEREMRRQGEGDRRREGGEGAMNQTKRRAFVTVVFIQIMLVVCYTPIIAVLPLVGRVSDEMIFCDLVPIASSFALFGSFVQPLLFLSRAGKLPWKCS